MKLNKIKFIVPLIGIAMLASCSTADYSLTMTSETTDVHYQVLSTSDTERYDTYEYVLNKESTEGLVEIYNFLVSNVKEYKNALDYTGNEYCNYYMCFLDMNRYEALYIKEDLSRIDYSINYDQDEMEFRFIDSIPLEIKDKLDSIGSTLKLELEKIK